MDKIINELSENFILPNLNNLKHKILLDKRAKSVNVSVFESEERQLIEWYLEVFYNEEYLLNVDIDEAALIIECKYTSNNYIFRSYFYLNSQSNKDYVYFPLANLTDLKKVYGQIFQEKALAIYYELSHRVCRKSINTI